jgi:hypothetical protein
MIRQFLIKNCNFGIHFIVNKERKYRIVKNSYQALVLFCFASHFLSQRVYFCVFEVQSSEKKIFLAVDCFKKGLLLILKERTLIIPKILTVFCNFKSINKSN